MGIYRNRLLMFHREISVEMYFTLGKHSSKKSVFFVVGFLKLKTLQKPVMGHVFNHENVGWEREVK